MKDNRLTTIRFMAEAAVISAMYAALTLFLAPISSGQVQVRVAEALTILPFFTPAAIPGLFVGCFISNLFVGQGIFDMILGPLVTLLAAWLSRRMPTRLLVPLPPVILNAVYVGFLLYYVADLPVVPTMLLVGAGEAAACYVLGFPLLLVLERNYTRLFGHDR